MLHIHCGEVSADQLRQSGVPGDVIVWSDILEQGPTPADLPVREWRAVRAAFLSKATGGAIALKSLEEHLTLQDAALEKFRDHEEVVLWFDACMYDQAILIRHLDWFASQDLGAVTLSLICVGEFPEFDHFKGLGELSSAQLAGLLDLRHVVEGAELELGQRAWQAWCSPDPRQVWKLALGDTSQLPFLHDALVRHLEQFPSTKNGMDRLRHQIIEVVAEGHRKLVDIFIQVSAREERPFFGDTTLWRCVQELESAAMPLLKVEGPPLPLWNPPHDLHAWTVSLHELGREVLAGRRDWIELNGINEWNGGVHLTAGNLWRWDADPGQLVRSNSRG